LCNLTPIGHIYHVTLHEFQKRKIFFPQKMGDLAVMFSGRLEALWNLPYSNSNAYSSSNRFLLEVWKHLNHVK
jgi:hypothetical protein